MSALARLEVALGEATATLVLAAVREEILPEIRREWTQALAEVEQRADGDWIPAARAALMLGCSLPALYAKVRRGTVPATKRGRRLYINRADLADEMENKRRAR